MYAKALIQAGRGIPAMPLLIAGVRELPLMVGYLTAHGWRDAAGGMTQQGNGELRITTSQRLQLLIGGEIMLDDTNPASPPGWWAAVEAGGGRCFALLSESGSVDLHSTDAGPNLERLMDQRGALYWASVPVTVDPK
ncbi:hypothetical protein [Arthrobacter sp. M4]|uniref:hypothetical protein n=1 Tax=Arthrobacter sp. M4 TaxID=218160 RepID=UPI001CDB5A85|nr:hypothetical protein [Arthrobacter sp. M4]MCA4135498.1 hypothetical protein [Arthrobacter sp. M4]